MMISDVSNCNIFCGNSPIDSAKPSISSHDFVSIILNTSSPHMNFVSGAIDFIISRDSCHALQQ